VVTIFEKEKKRIQESKRRVGKVAEAGTNTATEDELAVLSM